jgi:hypothetical protein
VYSKLTSIKSQNEVVKEKIRIRVIGFGWDDLHHPWSKGGVDYLPEQLKDHLINKIILEQSENKRSILDVLTVNIPSCGDRNKLGTKYLDVDDLKAKEMTRGSLLWMVERRYGVK